LLRREPVEAGGADRGSKVWFFLNTLALPLAEHHKINYSHGTFFPAINKQ
jgi:hypothetical protein